MNNDIQTPLYYVEKQERNMPVEETSPDTIEINGQHFPALIKGNIEGEGYIVTAENTPELKKMLAVSYDEQMMLKFDWGLDLLHGHYDISNIETFDYYKVVQFTIVKAEDV